MNVLIMMYLWNTSVHKLKKKYKDNLMYSLYDMSLYIFEGRNLYFNCVFIYSTLHV